MITRKILAGALAAGAVALAAPATAQAAVPDDRFEACWPDSSSCATGTVGNIHWANRTAVVTGRIWHDYSTSSSQLRFRAFAGTTRVGKEETRTIHAGQRPYDYDFVMGDTNLVGGINRIYIKYCAVPLDNCTDWVRFDK